ncbi:hypothetical protein FGIG_09667 [Fasciola gigantica]|uniref:Uncharacterized protein n=1 Tax=Fasciola gigantica TaxID=46835 RepID=A0A504YAY5_FASGI|nr:hypothetical protein FGIG_09667 [Fasciola gigantica]
MYRNRAAEANEENAESVSDTCRLSQIGTTPYNEALSASSNANSQLQAVSAKYTKQREMLHDLEGQQEQLTREVDRIHTELESANAQK